MQPIIPESFPFVNSAALTVYELSKLMQRRDAFRLDFLRNWRESAAQSDTGRPFDLIICPTTTHLAWPHLGKPQEPECVDGRIPMLHVQLVVFLELTWPFPVAD